jgi:hypothetical protein
MPTTARHLPGTVKTNAAAQRTAHVRYRILLVKKDKTGQTLYLKTLSRELPVGQCKTWSEREVRFPIISIGIATEPEWMSTAAHPSGVHFPNDIK